MADKLAIMLELERRGKLPADKQALLNEARKRGLVPPLQQAQPQGLMERLSGLQPSSNVEMAPPPNPAASQLPGPLGQLQNTSRAFQSGFMQGRTLGFGDEFNAAMMTPIEMGIDLFQGKGFDPGRSFNQALDKNRALDRANAGLNPAANVTGQIAGALSGPQLGWASKAKTTTQLAALGGAEGAVLGGLYGFGSSEGNLQDRTQGAIKGAATGGVMGSTVPVAAQKVGDVIEGALQSRATNAAIRNAPDAADLRAASSAMFKAVDNSGVTVDTGKFSQLVQSLVSQAKKDRINQNLDPKAWGAYEELIGALGDVQKNGGALTISDLHTLRQIAQKAAVSTEGRDSMFANRIVDALDGFVTDPAAMKLPANRLGNGVSTDAGNELLKAISTWSNAKKVSMIENAIANAENYVSGAESGLRNQFRTLLNGKKTRNLWSPAERKAMQEVINGGPIVQGLRALGMFKGFFSAGVGGGLGAAFGPLGTAAGTALGGAAGLLARKVTENAAIRAADKAAKVVATPNIPNVSLPIPMIPGAPFAYPSIDKQNRKPIAITIQGGSK